MTAPAITSLQPNRGIVGSTFGIIGTDLKVEPTVGNAGSMHLRFDGDDTDALGNYAQTSSGSPTYVTGKINQAINLNGTSQYVTSTLTHPGIMGTTDDLRTWSMSFWIKMDVLRDSMVIFQNGDTTVDTNAQTLYVDASGRINYYYGPNTPPSFTARGGSMVVDTWYNIIVTRTLFSSPRTMLTTVYIDNVSTIGPGTSSTFDSTTGFLRVGASDYGSGVANYFDGQIDDFRYYDNYLLTSSDRTNLLNSPSIADPTIDFDGTAVTGTTYNPTLITGVTVPGLELGVHPVTLTTTEGTSSAVNYTIVAGPDVDPQIRLRWSENGARSWGNEHWRSMGKKGEYETRVRWDRLGTSRNRVYEIQTTSKVKVAITGGTIESKALRN